ncbi:MAG: hypothetical protein JSU98_07315 [Gemmatimonadales bacterium]|jgi:hypothetical protein|nr:MAG: hypothetical protein JSU98_07315 [Gemmatimonadales bacterium]
MTLEVEGLRVPEEDRVSLVHALLGVTEGPGEVALVGRAARYAPGLASRIPGLELVAIHPATLDWTESPGVSRLVCGTRLPFMDRVFRGVVLEGPVTREGLREAARVLGRGHRTVVLDAPAEAAPTLMAAGLMVGVDQDGVVVAHR